LSVSKIDTSTCACDHARNFLQASCRGEVNECQNGGTMIWHPVKTFGCLCGKGYEGEICEKGSKINTKSCKNIWYEGIYIF
jgi:hypothetical protein